jgi:hypothetical protein
MAYDPALVETEIGLLKPECIRTTVFHPGPTKTLADVEFATTGRVDRYNHRRLDGSIGMVGPVDTSKSLRCPKVRDAAI